jgi:primosomal protein N' (replication factor Y) (superfamily II helicase)
VPRSTAPKSGQLWLAPTEGTPRHELVADVAVCARTWSLYSYAVPPELVERLAPGASVSVPLGRAGRTLDGWCIRVSPQPWDQTRKPILAVNAAALPLTATVIELALWVADYYHCPPARVIESIAPAALRRGVKTRVRCVRQLRREPPAELREIDARILALLEKEPRPIRALRDSQRGAAAALKRLADAGMIEAFWCVEERGPEAVRLASAPAEAAEPCPEDEFTLSAEQQAALRQIADCLAPTPTFRVLSLFGAPGSGKTEVYVRAIRAAVATGRQAILLVPEIALATQIGQRLSRRFTRARVLHSGLSGRARLDALRAIRGGNVDVVIGTRSAVFAPLERLGLVIVDEEQEGSLKSLAAPFYHARDVAIKRAQLENAPVVLGSATPSLETWHNLAESKHYQLLRMDRRIAGGAAPRVERVDPRRGPRRGLLSQTLLDHLLRVIGDGGQAILLHNRRGYAVHLRCSRCGLPLLCERCSSSLVLHRAEDAVRCHRCGLRRHAPAACPDTTCGAALEPGGLAIQRLEQDLHAAIPTARILRLDRDTMRRREDYAAALSRFERGDADVLIGTQMVAKGLDFPRVALAGVLDADAMFSMPDFRAAERAFQLLVQVVGRAGRAAAGGVAVIQTTDPEAPLLRLACDAAVEPFVQRELEQRRRLGYPPFARLVRIIVSDPQPAVARDGAERISSALREIAERLSAALRIGSAEVCAVARQRGMHRWQVLILGPKDGSIQRLLAEAEAQRGLRTAAKRCVVDVDPLDMM